MCAARRLLGEGRRRHDTQPLGCLAESIQKASCLRYTCIHTCGTTPEISASPQDIFCISTHRACGDGIGQLSVLNETLLGRARSIAGLNKHQIITITRHDDTTSSLRFVLLASDRCRCIGAKASPLSRHHVGVAGTPALMPPPAKHARCQATQCGKINAIRQSLH